jgi:transmembrane sensor
MMVSERKIAEEAAAAWILGRSSGAGADIDEAQFQAWLSASVGNRVAYYRLNAAWKAAAGLDGPQPAAAAGAPAQPAPRVQPRRHVAMAAGVLLALAAGLGAWWVGARQGTVHATVVGGLLSVPLEDGSLLTLNTDSEVRVRMDSGERRVLLARGEAFFQVAKDSRRPFVVDAGAGQVTAVGTAFSVRRSDAGTRVVVSEGAVRVQFLAAPDAVPEPLHAGQALRAAGADISVQALGADEIDKSLSWRSGLIVLRETSIAEAVAEFNRYNTRKIVVADADVAGLEVGGVFRATDVDAFLRLLEGAFPVRVVDQQGQFLLYAR